MSKALMDAQLARVRAMSDEDVLNAEIKPGRVKTLMKLAASGQEEKVMISGLTPGVLAFVTELFVKDLAGRAWREAVRDRSEKATGRKTILVKDVGRAVGKCENQMYDFLIDLVPHPL